MNTTTKKVFDCVLGTLWANQPIHHPKPNRVIDHLPTLSEDYCYHNSLTFLTYFIRIRPPKAAVCFHSRYPSDHLLTISLAETKRAGSAGVLPHPLFYFHQKSEKAETTAQSGLLGEEEIRWFLKNLRAAERVDCLAGVNNSGKTSIE